MYHTLKIYKNVIYTFFNKSVEIIKVKVVLKTEKMYKIS